MNAERSNYKQRYEHWQQRVEQHLTTLVKKKGGMEAVLGESMNYSLLAGGKRLRPVLLLATAACFGREDTVTLDFAAAIEMIHCYSLIHDDLPAMDDDEYRRGKKTNHIVYGEAMAILAGDALLNLSYETMLQQVSHTHDTAAAAAALEIATRAGYQGMIAGQAIDLSSEGKEISFEVLQNLHEKKTGALLSAAVLGGARLGGANDAQYRALEQYSQKLGLAFQITDDILDIKGVPETTGKASGMDAIRGKATYPQRFGAEQSEQMAQRAVEMAVDSLDGISDRDFSFLKQVAFGLLNRDR